MRNIFYTLCIMSELSKETQTTLITIGSTLIGAATGAGIGVGGGIAHVTNSDNKIKALLIARYAILPSCVIGCAAIAGTIGYFVSKEEPKA